MSNVVFCGLAPHPPILLPEVGGEESKKVAATFSAMETFARDVAASGAETIVIISPHGAVFRDGVAINGSQVLTGDLKQFGANLKFEYNNDPELVQKIIRQAGVKGIMSIELDDVLAREYGVPAALDHGVLIPMYFLDRAEMDLPVVSIAMSLLPFEELYAFGTAVKEAATLLNRKIAVIASGDMSHRLTEDAPAGYSPKGAVFDKSIKDLLKNGDARGIIGIDRTMAESAGECGLRSIIMMLGVTDGQEVEAKVLSYEGPFGVGYMVAEVIPTNEPKPSLLKQLFEERKEKIESRRAGESLPVSLARQALEVYVREGRKLIPDINKDPLLQQKAGVFVSIKKHGHLRGCIGTTAPTRENLAAEIVSNAISAGTGDPRFEPVEPDELEELVYSVDVLKAPEKIASTSQLDVMRYGVIVRSGKRSGLLLPNLEGVDTVEEQVAIAKQKAGILPDEPVELERFEVVRYY